MTNIKINLLKNRRVLSEKDFQKERQYLHWSVVGFIVVLGLTIALSIWNYLLASSLRKTEQAISTASTRLQGLAEANAQQVYLKNRLTMISKFLDERGVSREATQRIFSLSIPGTVVTSLSYVADNVIEAKVTAKDNKVLNEALKYYQTDGQFFPQVVSNGVLRLQDGSYELGLQFTLPTGNS